MNISQFLDGSLGLLSSHEGGIPVYCKTVFMPERVRFVGGTVVSPALVLIARTQGRAGAHDLASKFPKDPAGGPSASWLDPRSRR